MMLTAREIAPPGAPEPFDVARLSYDARWLRRSVIATAGGEKVLVDLAEATALPHGCRLLLTDGRTVAVEAEPEDLIAVTGDGQHHLARLAWHLGNRHLACQIEPERLLIRPDHVIERMLALQGAACRAVREPFDPEGGAYGAGRTHGHAHGGGHGHAHGHSHTHASADAHAQAHGHSHTHSHSHGDGRDHAHTHDHGHYRTHHHDGPHGEDGAHAHSPDDAAPGRDGA